MPMLWWDWTTRQRLALLATILGLSALTWVFLGVFPTSSYNLGVLIGGTAFLSVVQLVGWAIFVGLRTGRFPTSSGGEYRATSPAWFWATVCTYSALLMFMVGLLLAAILAIHLPFK